MAAASSSPCGGGHSTAAAIECMLRGCPIMLTVAWLGWSYSVCMLSRPFDLGWAAHTLVLALFIWSYVCAAWTPSVTIPDQFRLTVLDKSRLQAITEPIERANLLTGIVADRKLPIRTVLWPRGDRICEPCGLIKPDRAYHCQLCHRCQLGMSHHCALLASCIALHNQKAFMLSLFYGILLQGACSVSMVSPFLSIFEQEAVSQSVTNFNIMVLFLLSTIFGCLMLIFFLFRLFLLSKNQSTIEILKSPMFLNHGETFNLGATKNFQQVFGKNIFKSFLPIETRTHNGFDWEVKVVHRNCV